MKLVVIAKEPVPGRVKTRLSPPCSAGQAAAIAEAALADTLEAVAAVEADERVLVLEGRPGAWVPPGLRVIAQRGGGLDERLASAFEDVGGPALLIGMDTPQVTPAVLVGACRLLATDGVDAVLGAATDGGWWAVGLRAPDRRAFVGVPMSTPDTARAQRAHLSSLGLRVETLPALRDVDTWDDALVVADLAPATRFAAAVRGVAAHVGDRALMPGAVG